MSSARGAQTMSVWAGGRFTGMASVGLDGGGRSLFWVYRRRRLQACQEIGLEGASTIDRSGSDAPVLQSSIDPTGVPAFSRSPTAASQAGLRKARPHCRGSGARGDPRSPCAHQALRPRLPRQPPASEARHRAVWVTERCGRLTPRRVRAPSKSSDRSPTDTPGALRRGSARGGDRSPRRRIRAGESRPDPSRGGPRR